VTLLVGSVTFSVIQPELNCSQVRKLTYFIATSFDGFVSRPDGSINDFSFEGEHVADLLAAFPETIPTHLRSVINVSTENRTFDTVLMGRRTYDIGFSAGISSPYQHLQQHLFSNSLCESPDGDVILVNSDAVDYVKTLKSTAGLGIWLCGGPLLASELIDEIDDIIVKVNPFLMGSGKPLFARPIAKKTLRLVDQQFYSNGFALLHYDLDHSPQHAD